MARKGLFGEFAGLESPEEVRERFVSQRRARILAQRERAAQATLTARTPQQQVAALGGQIGTLLGQGIAALFGGGASRLSAEQEAEVERATSRQNIMFETNINDPEDLTQAVERAKGVGDTELALQFANRARELRQAETAEELSRGRIAIQERGQAAEEARIDVARERIALEEEKLSALEAHREAQRDLRRDLADRKRLEKVKIKQPSKIVAQLMGKAIGDTFQIGDQTIEFDELQGGDEVKSAIILHANALSQFKTLQGQPTSPTEAIAETMDQLARDPRIGQVIQSRGALAGLVGEDFAVDQGALLNMMSSRIENLQSALNNLAVSDEERKQAQDSADEADSLLNRNLGL